MKAFKDKEKTSRDFPGYVVNAYNAVVNASNAGAQKLILVEN